MVACFGLAAASYVGGGACQPNGRYAVIILVRCRQMILLTACCYWLGAAYSHFVLGKGPKGGGGAGELLMHRAEWVAFGGLCVDGLKFSQACLQRGSGARGGSEGGENGQTLLPRRDGDEEEGEVDGVVE